MHLGEQLLKRPRRERHVFGPEKGKKGWSPGQHPGEDWAGWSCPDRAVLIPAGCRNREHREGIRGGLSGEEPCGKWVTDWTTP